MKSCTVHACIMQSSLVCHVELPLVVNRDTGETATTGDSLATDAITIVGNTTVVYTSQLTPNHHYNITVVASNSAGTATSFATISKHIYHLIM